jgi:ATP-dependent DNA helicase RecQ
MSTSLDSHQILRDRFGHDRFLPGQVEVIERLLTGRSVLAIFPTGGGKSLCYQLPSVVLEGLTLVVSPLIALMKDQVDALREAGVAAARLDSTLEREQVIDIYERISDGRLRLLYVAPERLSNERYFRPDYLKLAELARSLEVERVLALTATATRAVARDIRSALAVSQGDEIRTPFHRRNLHLRVIRTRSADRPALLLRRLAETPPGPTIVYVTLQRTAEQVADALARAGHAARPYHAGMKDEARHSVQDAFMAGSCDVVVATIAFGMGIDKSDIRRIVHYNLPKTLEGYSQEIGRAGRDGQSATCELLVVARDQVPLANFTYGDTPSDASVRALVDELLGSGERFDVSRYDLSQRHDIRPLVVATALTYLELDGVLHATGPFYSGAQLRWLRPEDEVLAELDERERRYLETAFGSGRRGRVWLTLDLAVAAEATDGDRNRLVHTLERLADEGGVELRTAGLRHGYRRLREVDVGATAEELSRRFGERERQDIARLDEVLDYVSETGCRTQHLLTHFGEQLDAEFGSRCGHCSRCDGFDEGAPDAEPPPTIGAPETEVVRELVDADHAALAHPRALARLLCGLKSPAQRRAKLGRHPAFGALAEHRFADVLALAAELLPSSG